MEPLFLVCRNDAGLDRLLSLFSREALFAMRFDDGRIIVRLLPNKDTPSLLGQVPDIMRLPLRFSSVRLSKAQLAALPAQVRRKLRDKAFMRELFETLREEFPQGFT
jgi:hypothetical protein